MQQWLCINIQLSCYGTPGRRGVIANDTAMPGRGIGQLISARAVSRLVTSHIGLNPETQAQMNAGKLEVELQGSYRERASDTGVVQQGGLIESVWRLPITLGGQA